jgi:hypothetical protein
MTEKDNLCIKPNLEWIPNYLIYFESSNIDFIENLKNQDNYITINILFLSSKCLKLYISRREVFSSIEEWLYYCLEYYNSNFKIDYNLIFIHETKLIENKYSILHYLFNRDITDININCIIKKKNNTLITSICTSSNLYEVCFNHHIQTTTVDKIGNNCNHCQYYCSGILIPENIDPFNFPDIIPDEYIGVFTNDEWIELKCKINNKIESYYKYLDLSDEEVDKIESTLKYQSTYNKLEIEYLDNLKHPFSRFHDKLSKEYFDKGIHREYYRQNC